MLLLLLLLCCLVLNACNDVCSDGVVNHDGGLLCVEVSGEKREERRESGRFTTVKAVVCGRKTTTERMRE